MRVSIISSTLLICLSSFIFQVESKAQNTLRALELALRENDNTCEDCTTYTIETDTMLSSSALQEGKIWQFTSMAFELRNADNTRINEFKYPADGQKNQHQSLPMPAIATYKSASNAEVDNAAELTLTVQVARGGEPYMWKINKVTVDNKDSKHITLCPSDDNAVKCSIGEDTIIAFRLPHKPGDCSATATDAPLPSSNNNNNDKGGGNGNNGGNNPPVISTTAAPQNATKNGTQTGGGGKADATTEGGAAFCSLTLLAAYFAAASWMLV